MATPDHRVLISAGMIQAGKSGVGRYVIELVRHLREEDPNLELFVAGLATDRHFFTGIDDAHWIEIPVGFGSGFKNLVWHQWKLGRICREHDIHVLHIPSYRRILWRSPVPQVVTIHDCAPFILAEKYDPFRRFFGTRIVPAMARKCAQVIAVSQTTADDLVQFMKLPRDKVETVLNGIDHAVYRPPNNVDLEAFREEKGLDRPFFLYISRIEHPGKNHVRLVEAFERFRAAGHEEYELLLGGTDWHGAEVVHQRIAASSCRDAIRTLGFVPDEELPHWYAAAAALVHPSLFEGFGLPVAEAMACGTIVLTSDRGSLKEVGGPVAIYFDPESTDDIQAALQAFARAAPGDSASRREDGIQWVEQYSWRRCARECRTIYDRFLSSASYSELKPEENLRVIS